MPKGTDGRGRPRGASKHRIPPVLDEEWIEGQVRRAMAKSTLKEDVAKRLSGVALRAVIQENERLKAIALRGDIAADEARQIKPTAKAIIEIMKAMGVMGFAEEKLEL